MSRPVVIEVIERPSGKVDFHLSAGKEGRERVRVVRSASADAHYACMTCVTADRCIHADVAAERYRDYGASPVVGQERAA